MYTTNQKQKQKLAALLILLAVFTIPTAAETIVSVYAPAHITDDEFDVTIKIDDVDDLASGQFDLSFNSSVVNAIDLDDIDEMIGDVEGDDVPVEACQFTGTGSIELIFNPGVSGAVSGDGSLATIRFKVVGEAGEFSFLNFSDGKLVDKENTDDCYGDPKLIDAEWVNGMVTLGDPPSADPPDGNETTDPSDETTETHAVTVYVKNLDDDTLDVHLLIDGNDIGLARPSSRKTKVFEKKGYKLEEGLHTFKIKWIDPGTDELYEKTEEHMITDVTTIILRTDEHAEDEDKISAHVYVKNLDDDDLEEVYLYIDEDYKKYMSISPNSSGDYGEYEFEEDEEALHSFKIEWFDPGTGEEYEKIVRSYITGEEAVTLYVDRHTEEDIILLPDETPGPVSTHSTSTATTSQSASDSQPSIRNTPSSTTFHTDPTLSENSAENNGLGQGSTWYTLIGLVAVLFALIQIRRI